jgi:multiple sugar transport system permease protein
MTRSFSKISPGNIVRFIISMVVLVVLVYPVWWVVCIVFAKSGVSVTGHLQLYPTSLIAGIDKIIDVFHTTVIGKAYVNSLAYVFFQVLGVLLLSSMAAFEFSINEFPGKRFLFMLALVSLMVPGIVVLIPQYLLVADLHWLNTIQGLVVPGLASAFGLFVMTQFMESLPRELFDAAQIDGCNHFQLYWHIALPLSKNGLITLAILQFIRTWGTFIWPLVISQKQPAYTISQIVNSYNNVQQYATLDKIMAVNIMALIPSLIFYFTLQRFIVEGISRTGLK